MRKPSKAASILVPLKQEILVMARRCAVCQRNLNFTIENQVLRTIIVYSGDVCAMCDRVICACCAHTIYSPAVNSVTVCAACKPEAARIAAADEQKAKNRRRHGKT